MSASPGLARARRKPWATGSPPSPPEQQPTVVLYSSYVLAQLDTDKLLSVVADERLRSSTT